MSNDRVITFEIVRELVHGYRAKDDKTGFEKFIKCEYNGSDKTLWGCGYLLNQVLRQISVQDDHKLVSKAAQELWDQIAPVETEQENKGINDFYYHEKLTASKPGAEIYEYKGSNKNPNQDSPRRLEKGSTFIFRDVFHVEHIVPISMIIDRLVELDEQGLLTDEEINNTLNLIYVCRITKQEDRSIKEKYNRSLDVDEVLEKVYKARGIIVEK